MASTGVSLVLVVIALAVAARVAHSSPSEACAVRLRGVVTRNATGHWDVGVKVVHGQELTADSAKKPEWGTFDMGFTSVLTNNVPSLETVISIKGLLMPERRRDGAAEGRSTAADAEHHRPPQVPALAEPSAGASDPASATDPVAIPTTASAAVSTTAFAATPTAAPQPTARSQTPPPEDAATAVSRLRSLSAEKKSKRLIEAAKAGAVEEVSALVAAGADVEAGDESIQTALHWAARKGHVEAVRRLLKAGAAVSAMDMWRMTPLHWAVAGGNTAVVRLLLDASADPNARDQNQQTPLHWAALRRNTEAVAALLEGGADKRASDRWWNVALDIAKQHNHQQMVDLLRAHT